MTYGYCSSINCGDSDGWWWTMAAYYNDYVQLGHIINNGDKLFDYYIHHSFGVHPVITIVK